MKNHKVNTPAPAKMTFIQCPNCNGYGTKGYQKMPCPSCNQKGVLEVEAKEENSNVGENNQKGGGVIQKIKL